MFSNTPHSFGLISRFFHALMMALILAMMVIGLVMHELDKTSMLKQNLYLLHVSVGVLLLALAIMRMTWFRLSPPPPLAAGLEPWEKMLTLAVKGLMYLLMIAIPLSGWAALSARGQDVGFFGLMALPALAPENRELHEIMQELHEFLAFSLLLLVILHVAGALKHHFLDLGPNTETMQRMFGHIECDEPDQSGKSRYDSLTR